MCQCQDFMSLYCSEERITAFRWKIRLSNTGHKDDVTLELCFASLDGLHNPYFYLHLPIINDLGVLIPFMLFKAEFLAITSIPRSQITHNVWSVIREFKIISQQLEVFPTAKVFFSFYGTKISTKSA